MILEEIIKEAEKLLPFTTETSLDYFRVIVKNNHHWHLDMMLLLNDAPGFYDRPFYEVEFRKQYIKGIVIGLEFVQLVNGF